MHFFEFVKLQGSDNFSTPNNKCTYVIILRSADRYLKLKLDNFERSHNDWMMVAVAVRKKHSELEMFRW